MEDKKIFDNIEKYGIHIIHVSEDDKGPGFSYSIGLFKNYKHPEIIILGLNHELSHVLINNIAEDIKNGIFYESNIFYSDVLDNFQGLMLKVEIEHYNEFFGYAKWYYKNTDFPVLQFIYPTIKGIFPWEKEWPENIKNLQPILGNLRNMKL